MSKTSLRNLSKNLNYGIVWGHQARISAEPRCSWSGKWHRKSCTSFWNSSYSYYGCLYSSLTQVKISLGYAPQFGKQNFEKSHGVSYDVIWPFINARSWHGLSRKILSHPKQLILLSQSVSTLLKGFQCFERRGLLCPTSLVGQAWASKARHICCESRVLCWVKACSTFSLQMFPFDGDISQLTEFRTKAETRFPKRQVLTAFHCYY